MDGVLNSKFWDNEHQREISEGKYVDLEAVKLLGSLAEKMKNNFNTRRKSYAGSRNKGTRF